MKTTFKIDPSHASIGTFFKGSPLYRIPKYQRSYAWDKSEVEDFIRDLNICFNSRKNKKTINHFFGGIVSIGRRVEGTVNQNEYEIIDGQQRMATFVILVSGLIATYEDLKIKADKKASSPNSTLLLKRIERLTQRFIEIEQEINRVIKKKNVMTLSKADNAFFQDLIRGHKLVSTENKHSHRLLALAHKKITSEIKKIAKNENARTIEEQMDNLELVENIIENDFSLLHMVTLSREDAYKLFQVLNNRGKNLTEGDLLRARTLEMLEKFPTEQSSIEESWDRILADKPSETLRYLKWIYSSRDGNEPKSISFYQDFLDKFYPSNRKETKDFGSLDSKSILTETQSLEKEVQLCRTISNGEWPFEKKQPIQEWDRNRLAILINDLGHTLAVPLFLAATKLDHKKFSDIVQIVERFAFRYIYLCNQHAGGAKKIYNETAAAIRSNPATYKHDDFIIKLRNLQNSKAPNTILETAIENLNYSKIGRSNKPLKYFLLSCEYFFRWYKDGATGVPECKDKTRVYNFLETTIEHIYPRSAKSPVFDEDLEPLKNTLGNLTILGPNDNETNDNDDFAAKMKIFQANSGKINSEIIASKTSWDTTEIDEHKELLKDIALNVFKI